MEQQRGAEDEIELELPPIDEGYGGISEPESNAEGDEGLRVSTASAVANTRARNVVEKNRDVMSFHCDEKRGEWCEFELEFAPDMPMILMYDLVKEAVRWTLIRQVHGIGTATFESGDGKPADKKTGRKPDSVVHTEGVGLRLSWEYGDFIDPNRTETNDIAQVLDVYGVEACRGCIIEELGGVFGSHGISVDPRHLNLIGDYMTRWDRLE